MESNPFKLRKIRKSDIKIKSTALMGGTDTFSYKGIREDVRWRIMTGRLPLWSLDKAKISLT